MPSVDPTLNPHRYPEEAGECEPQGLRFFFGCFVGSISNRQALDVTGNVNDEVFTFYCSILTL